MMKKVLIVNPSFYPGYRSGGPQRTVENICHQYKDVADIYVLTLNHDYMDDKAYAFPVNKWIKLCGIKACYVTDKGFNLKTFYWMYHKFDIVYSCGLFCKNSYELMLISRIKNNTNKRLYVAPMGVFSPGAISLKAHKKRIFLWLLDRLNIYKNTILSFSSLHELEDARKVIGNKNIPKYIIAEDLPRKVDFNYDLNKDDISEKGKLNVVFLSRISPMKNLLYCADIFRHDFKGNINFDIYGVIENQDYYTKCLQRFEKNNSSVSIAYKGEVRSEDVIKILSQYDVFLFPTKGENYGHVIYEALASGCLPLISDTTPWLDLDKRCCGHVIGLDNISKYREALQSYIDMDRETLILEKINAIKYAEEKYVLSKSNSGYNEVFL